MSRTTSRFRGRRKRLVDYTPADYRWRMRLEGWLLSAADLSRLSGEITGLSPSNPTEEPTESLSPRPVRRFGDVDDIAV